MSINFSKVVLVTSLIVATGCSSELALLKVEHRQLTNIDQNMAVLSELSQSTDLSPGASDAHIQIGREVFNGLLDVFDGTSFAVRAGGRDVEVTIDSVRIDFRPGNAVATIDASAYEPQSGWRAGLAMDATFTLSKSEDNIFTLSVNATRIAPSLSWRGISLSRYLFVRRLAAIEAYQITEKLPTIEFPLSETLDFDIAATQKSETIPTGRGSMTGTIKTPPISLNGKLSVYQIVILENGGHLLCRLEAA